MPGKSRVAAVENNFVQSLETVGECFSRPATAAVPLLRSTNSRPRVATSSTTININKVLARAKKLHRGEVIRTIMTQIVHTSISQDIKDLLRKYLQ